MEYIVYVLMVSILLIIWLWSHYVQWDLIVNRVSTKIGEGVSWVIALTTILGVITIIISNFLPVQIWKVFFLLISYMGVGVAMFWILATWVHAYVSRKIGTEYHIKNKTRETLNLIISILISVILIVVLTIKQSVELSVITYLTLPVILFIERVYSSKKRIKEISKYDVYTDEEIKESNERFNRAVEDGRILKPRENILTKHVNKERQMYRSLRQEDKIKNASESIVETKRHNDKKDVDK